MNVKQLIFTGIILAIIAVGMPVASADGAGWYVGAGAGNADVNGSAFEDDRGVKLFAGYHFNEHLALEGGYVDLGEFDVEARPGSSVEIDGFQFVAVGIIPIKEKFSVFGKAGAYAWDADGELGDYQGTVFTFGVGVTYAGKVAVRVEWERFDIDLLSVSVVFGLSSRA